MRLKSDGSKPVTSSENVNSTSKGPLTAAGGMLASTVGAVVSSSTEIVALKAALPLPASSVTTLAGSSTETSPLPSGVIVTVKTRGPPLISTVALVRLKSDGSKPATSSENVNSTSKGPLAAAGGMLASTVGAALSIV